MSSAPTAIDLFCGAGGLTRGLRAAGFDVVAGVEVEATSAATYALNNPNALTLNHDIRTVTASSFSKVLRSKRPALLAACPPCQGFTSLTSKFRRDDPRNDLADEVIRLTRSLRPGAVMFENVPRFLTSKRGKRRFDRIIQSLEALGYEVSYAVLQAADFGTAQMRRRLVVYAASELIEPPTPTHGPEASKPWRTVEHSIKGESRPEIYDVSTHTRRKSLSDWHVVRNLTPINQARLAAAKPGQPRWTLPDELRPDCHKGSSSGFANVYGRMMWGTPSPTITGGCTSPSKGRFGHPSQARTISVMEAGMLQDFPKGYAIAASSIEDVCSMIGNAFPARLAAAAAKQLAVAL